MKKNSPTEAGQTNQPSDTNLRIDVINQCFALFRRNYHNQYYKAFPDETELNVTKRLWLDTTQTFTPEAILKAARTVIESTEFLPTLHTMLKHCKKHSANPVPEAHQAYIEACQAPSPKAAYKWSHPAVYHAGKAADWFFLQNTSEHIAFPIFKEKYQQVCARVDAGEKLDIPTLTALPKETLTPIDKSSQEERIQSLKDALDL